ncbi:hypothetical protein B0H21DRAFT_777693 [Amylocystis lapponica]|nr:hypothetical protein B0H21DRAFT_777693 [Amylocystis lapponica]
MDSLQFDSYTSYSDASTPRTPSPRSSLSSDDMQHYSAPHYKPVDLHIHRNIFDQNSDDHGIVPSTTPSRLPICEQHSMHDSYHMHQQSADPAFHGGGWSNIPQSAHGESPISHSMRHPHDVVRVARRATFPCIPQDQREVMYTPPPFAGSDYDSMSSSPYGSRPSTVYSEPLSMDGSPHLMAEHLQHNHDEPFAHSVPMGNSPHLHYHDYHHLDVIKTEENASLVPSQGAFCRPPSAGMHPLPCLSPHTGILVQHTDDAASKETQYLRRRCFNCHTTEPPSWRRSTLNPGKIVCNKCGLYERTHLRPRPLRFDELRAGSKTRKQPKASGSPKAGKLTHMVKKEPRDEMEGMVPRRTSSDWDDNVSLYSQGSASHSSVNSPAASPYPIPRDTTSQSPPLAPRDGGIRLPNAPLSDIASLQGPPPSHQPRKSASAPMPYYPAPLPHGHAQAQADYFRRGSLPAQEMQRRTLDVPIPEVTGWQSVPLADLAPGKPVKSRKVLVA